MRLEFSELAMFYSTARIATWLTKYWERNVDFRIHALNHSIRKFRPFRGRMARGVSQYQVPLNWGHWLSSMSEKSSRKLKRKPNAASSIDETLVWKFSFNIVINKCLLISNCAEWCTLKPNQANRIHGFWRLMPGIMQRTWMFETMNQEQVH